MIRLGYAGINTYLPTASRTFRLANYTEERMLLTARANLLALLKIFQWNVEKDIKLFRISSGLIPFGSHQVNSGIWKKDLKDEFIEIGNYIKDNSLRVSMHPGQYTVLNSPNMQCYYRAIKDLEYHCAVLDLLNVDNSHKVVIHAGGVYQNRDDSTIVFINRLKEVPQYIHGRLVIENDEKNYNAEQIYKICKETQTSGVLDIFHHQCLPSFQGKDIKSIINIYKETWPSSQRQKIHYSNQAPDKHRGAHSSGISVEQFSLFYKSIKELDLDIMLETKDKQVSVLCIRKKFPEIS